jgi:hypothetical protein
VKTINAIYNFLVGDIVILLGIVFALLLLILIHFVAALAPVRAYSGAILIVATLVVLAITFRRELRGR